MAGVTSAASFRADLMSAELLIDAGSPGLYHRSETFESIVTGLTQLTHDLGADTASRRFHFAPMMRADDFVDSDYLRSFPDLTGVITGFDGDDAAHAALLAMLSTGGDWSAQLTSTGMVLCSAVCHSLYPRLRGSVATFEGAGYECHGQCFRREPSSDPTRMQSFRMHEFVFVGDAERARQHRDDMLLRGLALLAQLGLEVDGAIANDPFFGRAGRMLAAHQREEHLKWEIVAPVVAEQPTAIASANLHLDHFGVNYSITLPDGSPAHTACFGFGLERIALALLARHGFDPGVWPTETRALLWPAVPADLS